MRSVGASPAREHVTKAIECCADGVVAQSSFMTGVMRLRVLVDALAVLERVLAAAGGDALTARDASTLALASSAHPVLLDRLAAANPEAACAAKAILALGPA